MGFRFKIHTFGTAANLGTAQLALVNWLLAEDDFHQKSRYQKTRDNQLTFKRHCNHCCIGLDFSDLATLF